MPLGIIQTDRVVVTVCSFESELIRGLTNGRVRNLSTSKRNRFILHMLLSAANKYLSNLRDINKVVDGLEDHLQMSLNNRELLELLKYQKSLTYFTTALKSNELMMERLQRSQLLRTYPDDEDLLEDVADREPAGHRNDQHHQQHPQQHDGRLRLDHLQQPERCDEVPGRGHDRPRAADDDRQLLRDERPPAAGHIPWRFCTSWGRRWSSPSA